MYRVVIADDLAVSLRQLRRLLEGSGDFRVLGEASTGRETLGLVDALKPDLVISDLDLPDLDGLAVARYLHHQHPQTRIILVSVHTDPEYATLAQEEGALAFIPKDRLSMETLRQVLGRKVE